VKKKINSLKNSEFSKNNLFNDDSYEVYILSAGFLAKYAKKFDNSVNEDKLKKLLELYMVLVKAVDRETDSGEKTMGYYCDVLENPKKYLKKEKLAFFALKFNKEAKLNKKDLANFRIVAKDSFQVANAKNVEDYLFYRERVTKYLGIIGLKIMEKFIHNKRFDSFVLNLLNCSDLLDIVLDIKEDKQRGEIKFRIGLVGYLKIYWKVLKNLFLFLIKYSFVLKDFFKFLKRLKSVKF
jgi:hypothetical protein